MPEPIRPPESSRPVQAAVSPRRFFGPLVWTTIWTALAVVLLGAAAAPWLFSDPTRISRLIARAAPELEADVVIGGARVGWAGPIVIEDMQIVPRNGARPPLTIKRIEGSHGLVAMLISGGDLGRFRIEGLEADIVFDTDRTSNLTGLIRPDEGAGAGGSTGPRRSPLRIRFEIDDAIARIEGPWATEPWVSDPTDVKGGFAPLADGSGSAWTIEKVQLLRNAKLAANVAQGVLAYIAPVLADATRTSGRFSLRLDGATLPMGAPESARLAGVLSMHEVDVGPGPLATRILDSLPGRLDLPRAIRVADDSNVEFHLANRRVWHKGLEFGIPLAKPGQRLDIESSGSVGLDDRSLDLKLALPVPVDLPADRPLLAALAGKSISIGVGGVLGEPKVNFDGSIRAAAGDVVTDLVERLRHREQAIPPRPSAAPAPKWVPPQTDAAPAASPAAREPAPAAADAGAAADQAAQPAGGGGDPAANAIIDLVGGVLDEVARRRAERAAATTGNPEAPPPPGPRRGGRFLRRFGQPPAAPPETAP